MNGSCSALGAQRLGAALNQCGACPPAPPARNWIRADLVTSDRVGLGQVVQARLNSVPATDSLGRIAHVRGIYYRALAQLTVAEDAQAVSAYQLRSIFQSNFLRDVTGHEYWSNLDGRTILDDQFFRHGTQLNAPFLHWGTQGRYPTITADGGYAGQVAGEEGEVLVDISLYAPLATLGGKHPYQGVIPLASLQRAGSDALRFRVRQGLPGNPTGTTFSGLYQVDEDTTGGMEIWLDVIYLDQVWVDAPWILREYTLSEQSGMLNYQNMATEYAWLRYFPEDTFNATPPLTGNGQSLVELYDGFTLQVAGFTLLGGAQLGQTLARMQLYFGSMKEGFLLDNNPTRDMPLYGPFQGNNYALGISLIPYQGRGAGAAQGGIYYEFNTRTPTQSRFVHRAYDCKVTPANAAKIVGSTSCDPCAVLGTNAIGATTPNVVAGNPIVVVPTKPG